jgi:aminocarboxymuconate-semialdehyde decarboxylase
MIDCQWHWYPRSFFEAQLGRRGYPRARRQDGGLFYEVAPGAALRIELQHTDLDLQLEAATAAGIDAVVSSPASIGVDGLPPEEARELAQLLNEEQSKAQRAYPGRFYGLATLPLHDADSAVAALDDAVLRLGLRALYLHSNVDGDPLDSDRLRPVYARAAALGLPIFLHPAKSIFAASLPRFGLDSVVGYVFETTVAALTLVFGGILDEFEELLFVHPHLGGTVPFLAGRIDYEYWQPWAHNAKLARPPSEYLRRFYVDSVSRNPGALALASAFYGSDRILLGSDYPWWPADEAVALVRSSLEPAALAALDTNAERLLRL